MAEPIQWANRGQPKLESFKDGRRVIERIPQTATVGDYDSAQQAIPRYRRVIDSYGNDIRIPITTSAADVDVEGAYARQQRAKWRRLGWYEVGHCPIAMTLNGELVVDHFVSPSVREDAKAGAACAPGSYNIRKPCRHAIEERDARQAQNARDTAERMKNFRSESDRLIAAQAQGNAQLLEGFAGQMANVVRETVAAVQGSQPTKEKAGK